MSHPPRDPEADAWQAIADCCTSGAKCDHYSRHLAEIPQPRYEECRTVHTRPGGERVVCIRESGHTGRHVGLATQLLHYTWDSPALTAAVTDSLPHCICGADCQHG